MDVNSLACLPFPDLKATIASMRASAVLQEGLRIANDDSLAEDARKRFLRSALRVVSPGRKRVGLGDSAIRMPVGQAPLLELLRAFETDMAPIVQRANAAEDASATPYRCVERRFRPPAGPRADSKRASVIYDGTDGVATVEEALAEGAISFGLDASWRSCDDLRTMSGISLVANQRGPEIYALGSVPGFYFLPGRLGLAQQEALAESILARYAERPNRRNVDSTFDPDVSNIIMTAAKEPRGGDYQKAVCAVLQGDASASVGAAGASVEETSAMPKPSTPAFPTGIWDSHMQELRSKGVCHDSAPAVASDDGLEALAPSRDSWLSKLTWCTLGCQYDWTARKYHLPMDSDYALHAHAYGSAETGTNASRINRAGRWFAPFPSDLHASSCELAAEIDEAASAHFASCSPEERQAHGLPMVSFDAQSGICNVYQYGPHGRALRGVPMGGHRDDMERRWDRPVISMNVGCAAIYLLGGARKDDAPVPILVRSGDVMILSGSCRLAFHGVARVFDGSAPAELFAPTRDETAAASDALERAAFRAFVQHARLNVNVRQVM